MNLYLIRHGAKEEGLFNEDVNISIAKYNVLYQKYCMHTINDYSHFWKQ